MLNLEAIELIKQLKSRYFRYLDTCNMEGMKTVFSEDGEIDFNSPTYQIHHKGWGEIEKFYRSAFTETKFGIHIGTNPEITVAEDGENATGIWYLRDIFVSLDDNVQVEGSAFYEDVYRKFDGEWKIVRSSYQRLMEQITMRNDSMMITSRPIGQKE